jgi:hypothetical protein
VCQEEQLITFLGKWLVLWMPDVPAGIFFLCLPGE